MANQPNLKSELAVYLESHPSDDKSFPRHDIDYYERFRRVDEYLNLNVHPNVNQGATAASASGKVWLTDHGPKHIETVIRRASDFCCNDVSVLTPYEAYLLLLAIHFHDTGNLFGRDKHEQKIAEIMSTLDRSLIGDDTVELRLIREIATAHGGYYQGQESPENKDTIGKLSRRASVPQARSQLLAATLRLADEFAEDKTRANRWLLDGGIVPPECEAYHRFAAALSPIRIDPHEGVVEVDFELSADLATTRVRMGDTHPYLFDLIQQRLLKMHHEHIYCSRFMEPHVHIAQIDVSINVCSNDFHQVLLPIEFTMAVTGYPDHPQQLADICPGVGGKDGEWLSAEITTRSSNAANSAEQGGQ